MENLTIEINGQDYEIDEAVFNLIQNISIERDDLKNLLYNKHKKVVTSEKSNSSNILLMPFLDESSNYVNGFEAGQIWELLQQGEMIESRLCHLENKQQIEMICETFSCNYFIEDVASGWIVLNVKPTIIE
jgi:hypothetical protein